ncbi:MAG: ACT domain-containing protein [archaeon]
MNEEMIKVWNEDFVIVKSKKVYENAFANIKNKNELTVIVEQGKIDEEDIIEIEKDWKLITFDTVLDFGLVGFISKISSALAEANISIFVVSSYSTDHILIKKSDLDKTLGILKNLEVSTK